MVTVISYIKVNDRKISVPRDTYRVWPQKPSAVFKFGFLNVCIVVLTINVLFITFTIIYDNKKVVSVLRDVASRTFNIGVL